MIRSKILWQVAVFSFALLLPLYCFGGSLYLSQTSGSTYILKGTNLDGINGLDITVKYDSTVLSSPRVDTVSGGLLANAIVQSNPNAADGIRIVALSASGFKGSGSLVTITFNNSSDTPAINQMIVKAINVQGVKLPINVDWVRAQADNSGNSSPSSNTPYINPGGGPTTTVVTGSGASGIQPVIGGSVSMPTQESAAKDRKESTAPSSEIPPVTTPAISARENASAPQEPREQMAAPKPAEPPAPPVPSVLERFRVFAGELSLKNLTALFDRSDATNFVQDPPIFIADGKQTVKVTISKVRGEKSPNFTFSSARYVSLTEAGEGAWLVEVRPDKDVTRASIVMVVNGITQEFPLTVAPKTAVDLDKDGKVTQADAQLFLSTRGTAKAPKYDLNGDGKRDYLDDYIFLANYLVEREKQAAKEKVETSKGK